MKGDLRLFVVVCRPKKEWREAALMHGSKSRTLFIYTSWEMDLNAKKPEGRRAERNSDAWNFGVGLLRKEIQSRRLRSERFLIVPSVVCMRNVPLTIVESVRLWPHCSMLLPGGMKDIVQRPDGRDWLRSGFAPN